MFHEYVASFSRSITSQGMNGMNLIRFAFALCLTGIATSIACAASMGDDTIEMSQGMLDADHELMAVYWFCKEHQRVWYVEPTLTLEASRTELQVRLKA